MKKLLIPTLAVLFMTGCISSKSYVDPSFGKATYDDIQKVETQHAMLVDIEFQRNGEAFPDANAEVRSHVERTLRASGVITPALDGTPKRIKVTVNNVADLGEAAAKGFGTGLTFGAVGTLVTDYYEVSITYTDEDGELTTKEYKHALHTTIGNKGAPFENAEPMSPASAFGVIVEQVLLNFIQEMQQEGKLVRVSVSPSIAA